MTEHASSTAPRPAARRRPPLYRTVLALGVAAIAATWLPFSFLYVSALSKKAPVIATSAPQSTSAVAATHATTLAAVTTRTS
ncbi:MAG TPA: hypothetical protein VGH24_12930 [Solirubrobacteraceae bacterium]